MKIEKKIYKLTRKRLEQSLDCDFKKAFLPKGWACCKIKTFAKELTDDIVKLIK